MEDEKNHPSFVLNADFYNSFSQIQSLLDSKGFSMQKKFGQNFLLNQKARESIVSHLDHASLNLQEDTIWEIGAGLGAITYLLDQKCKHLILFEIDRGFILLLKEWFPHRQLVEGDALKTIEETVSQLGVPKAIVGNLPYNVGSQIIAQLIEKNILPQMMLFTLQKEVVLRMSAKEGSRDFSSFTLLCNLDYEVTRLMDLSPKSFYPPPQVTSSVVRLVKKNRSEAASCSPDNLAIRKIYFKLIRSLFQSRRKTIRNNLLKKGFLSSFDEEVVQAWCESAKINLNDRGEKLSVEKIWKLACLIEKNKKIDTKE